MVKYHLFQLRIKNSFVKEISAMYVITKLLLTYTIITTGAILLTIHIFNNPTNVIEGCMVLLCYLLLSTLIFIFINKTLDEKCKIFIANTTFIWNHDDNRYFDVLCNLSNRSNAEYKKMIKKACNFSRINLFLAVLLNILTIKKYHKIELNWIH